MTPHTFQFNLGLFASVAVVFLVGCDHDAPSPKAVNPTHAARATSESPLSPDSQISPNLSESNSPDSNTEVTAQLETRPVASRERKTPSEQFLNPQSPHTKHQVSNSNSPEKTAQEKNSADDHEFEPPFGERVNLFLPAENSGPTNRKSERAVGPTIQLKGFAQVHQLRAVLSLDGRVITLAAGEEKEGIRAISIQPPRVQLQKGRQRWTLTLSKSLGPTL